MGYTQQGGTREHPEGTKVLVLGILGVVLCNLLAPFAWVIGNRVVKEVDASPGGYSNRGTANAGRICGMVISILLIIGLVLGLGLAIPAGASGDSSSLGASG